MARGADEGARVLSRIFHIASQDDWMDAQAKGVYTADSLTTEGFIHCSDGHQVVWVANQRFRDREDLVLLHIDAARLGCDVRYENLEGGTSCFRTSTEPYRWWRSWTSCRSGPPRMDFGFRVRRSGFGGSGTANLEPRSSNCEPER